MSAAPAAKLSCELQTLSECSFAAGESRVIANVHWHGYEPEKVEIDLGHERSMLLYKFFPYVSEFSANIARTFTLTGQTFKWTWTTQGGSHFELTDTNHTLLARDFRRVEGHMEPQTHPKYIDVTQSAMDMTDLVMTTYICIEEERRQLCLNWRNGLNPGAATTNVNVK